MLWLPLLALRSIHPLLRGADVGLLNSGRILCDSSPLARGRLNNQVSNPSPLRFIPSCEGQTRKGHFPVVKSAIHPLLRGADSFNLVNWVLSLDSSPLARGRRNPLIYPIFSRRFIPSCEGQTDYFLRAGLRAPIHPLLRGADRVTQRVHLSRPDSSPLARGRHSMFMRLSAALNTSLCNLHKCPFQLVTHHFLYL